MTVYLLHFSDLIAPGRHTAQHYLGFTEDLDRRIAEHDAGEGSRLCQVAKERGLTFVVARTWQGGRLLERQLKGRHEGPRLCPICRQSHVANRHFLRTFTLAEVPELEF